MCNGLWVDCGGPSFTSLADFKAYECKENGELCLNWLLFGLIFVIILNVFVSKSISLLLNYIHRRVGTGLWTQYCQPLLN